MNISNPKPEASKENFPSKSQPSTDEELEEAYADIPVNLEESESEEDEHFVKFKYSQEFKDDN